MSGSSATPPLEEARVAHAAPSWFAVSTHQRWYWQILCVCVLIPVAWLSLVLAVELLGADGMLPGFMVWHGVYVAQSLMTQYAMYWLIFPRMGYARAAVVIASCAALDLSLVWLIVRRDAGYSDLVVSVLLPSALTIAISAQMAVQGFEVWWNRNAEVPDSALPAPLTPASHSRTAGHTALEAPSTSDATSPTATPLVAGAALPSCLVTENPMHAKRAPAAAEPTVTAAAAVGTSARTGTGAHGRLPPLASVAESTAELSSSPTAAAEALEITWTPAAAARIGQLQAAAAAHGGGGGGSGGGKTRITYALTGIELRVVADERPASDVEAFAFMVLNSVVILSSYLFSQAFSAWYSTRLEGASDAQLVALIALYQLSMEGFKHLASKASNVQHMRTSRRNNPRAFHMLALFALETMQMAFSRNIFLSPESTTGSVIGSSAVRLLVNSCLVLGQLTHRGHALKRRWRVWRGKSGAFSFPEHVRGVLVRHLFINMAETASAIAFLGGAFLLSFSNRSWFPTMGRVMGDVGLVGQFTLIFLAFEGGLKLAVFLRGRQLGIERVEETALHSMRDPMARVAIALLGAHVLQDPYNALVNANAMTAGQGTT